MTIVKANHDKGHPYTQLSNAAIGLDSPLTLAARGLLAFMLSLPDDWKFSVNGLVEVLPGNGKSSIERALRELEAKGHVVRPRQQHNAHGEFLPSEWIVRESPNNPCSQPLTENQSTVVSRANRHYSSSQPLTGLPLTVNPPQQNKEQQSKDDSRLNHTKVAIGDEGSTCDVQPDTANQVVTRDGLEQAACNERIYYASDRAAAGLF